jgi:DNA excision repair protein ERCC-6-like 2
MHPLNHAEVVVLDDDATASESDTKPSKKHLTPTRSKRKHEPDNVDEKVIWTDESDQDTKPRKGKRRSTVRAKKKTKTRRSGKRNGPAATGADTDSEDDAAADAVVPEYIRHRRKVFEENVTILKEAGLRLPPNYSDISFQESGQPQQPRQKPQFDPTSGVKPCRPYADIELEHSGGFIPASIAQYLRDYQVAGVRFLHKLFVYQKGGILGDDMGLGKTVQVAAFLTAAFGKTGDERDEKRMRKMRRLPNRWYPRILIVVPGTLIQNWKNELDRWGWWHVDVCHGPAKEDAVLAARSGLLEVMITTYQTYKLNRDLINTVEWDAVVADECHTMKDPSSETTKAMAEVNSLCRIGLTGTAIQNSYEELWTLLNWTNPSHFGTLAEWKSTISEPLRVGQSHDATLAQLSLARRTAKKLVDNLLPPFFLRRMKSLIAHQLPRKSDKVVFCPLTEIQDEAYRNFLESEEMELIRTLRENCDCGEVGTNKQPRKRGWCCQERLPDGRPWRAAIFPFMFALQKMSNHLTLLVPNTVDLESKQEAELRTLQMALPDKWRELYRNRENIVNLANPEFCGKWKILKKLLRFWHDNGDKVLVFSHSVRLLRILQYLFKNTSYSVSYLDGSMSYEDRQKTVDNFNCDPGQFAFLISTKAGGVGLNITSANKVVIVDPHWNPSYDLQAQDRAYRIGQTRDVDVFRLVAAGTIEEIVYARQIYKQQQANIGYTASKERRYFKGVQNDEERKGEIFGLQNLFTYHGDQMVLRDIVNKTNIAETKAGISLVDVDIGKMAKEGEFLAIKKEEDDEGGVRQLAALATAEDPTKLVDAKRHENKAKSDANANAIQAILQSVGVEYMHENSEVVGSSRVEQQLSRRAELAEEMMASGEQLDGDSALFADDDTMDLLGGGPVGGYKYNPPEDVMMRQFCSMAKEFRFPCATEFALVVESWTQEQRRNCLDGFYKRREAILRGEGEKSAARQEVAGVKEEKAKEEKVRIKEEKLNDTDVSSADHGDAHLVATEGVAAELESEVKIKVEKRSSVFLSDEEDDDEL